jgi:hypothetical protein
VLGQAASAQLVRHLHDLPRALAGEHASAVP